MQNAQYSTDILIVGAGMAGLAAASELRKTGRKVLVIDKGRGVGGRLANRRFDGATFDIGAQFLTAREPRFAAAVDVWLKAGVAVEWYGSSTEGSAGHPHWRGKPAMTAIAKHLADNVELLLGKRATLLRQATGGWSAELESGDTVFAGAVLLTPPVPQSMNLLESGGFEPPQNKKTSLENMEYERCFAVMAALDGPSRIPAPGWFRPDEGPIVWLADNQIKGVSAIPAVTIHATADFSLEHWDTDRQETGRMLLRAAEPWLGSHVTEFQVHGWRYSKPVRTEKENCMVLNQSPPLLIAGDAFAGPRVEGAALSGWTAAETLSQMK